MEDDINFIQKLYNHLTLAEWPNLQLRDEKILTRVESEDFLIAEKGRDQYFVNLIGYNSSSGAFEPYTGLSKISFDHNENSENFIYLGGVRSRQAYGLNRSGLIKAILQVKEGKHEGCIHINISSQHSRLSFSNTHKVLKVPTMKYYDILSRANDISKKTQSYAKSIERHLVNQATSDYLGVSIQKVTNLSKGEFAFLTYRLNLETKNKKADFLKYLDSADVQSLQSLTMSMIEHEVFDLDYLHKLDAYFLKEKLEDIVSLGKSIISLKSTDLTTSKAKSVILKLFKDEHTIPQVKQLETLWQKYFEKYLLYLIFTYRQIYSKIPLRLEGDEKQPDFLGINHYNGVDAIEIKTHLKPALVRDGSHDNFAFSSELSKAIIQTTNYIDAIKERAFVNDADLQKLVAETEKENLYRPRGIIIISSRDRLVKNQVKWNQDKVVRDFTKLRNSLGGIEILTFDEVLEIASNYASKIANKVDAPNQQ